MTPATTAHPHARRRPALATAARLAALAIALLTAGVSGCGKVSPTAATAPSAPQPTLADQLLQTGQVAAGALADTAATTRTNPRDAAGAPFAALQGAVVARGGAVSLQSTGRGAYAASGLLTITGRGGVVAGAPTVCVKVPAGSSATRRPVAVVPLADAGPTAAADSIAVFRGMDGTDCATLADPPSSNLVPNPSGEDGTTGWTATQAGLAPDPAPASGAPRYGHSSVWVGVGSPAGFVATPRAAVTPGQPYASSIYVIGSSGQLCLGWQEFDAAGTEMRRTPCERGPQLGAGWLRLTRSDTVPGDVHFVALYVSTAVGAASFWTDAAQLEPGSTVTSYVDGSLGDGYAWTGPPNESASTRADGIGVG